MSEKDPIILSTCYLGPVSYYAKFFHSNPVFIEKHENYIKQSYRNRCIIYGANGQLTLVIPVKRGSFHKTAISKLEIDYKTNWQANHLHSITSAYRSSPFFEFYIDDFIPFYKKKFRYLIEYNNILLKVILQLLGTDKEINYTKSFTKNYPSPHLDLREKIHPKRSFKDPLFDNRKYTQVFEQKHGFISNLSIIDLLFNLGPESADFLRKSINL